MAKSDLQAHLEMLSDPDRLHSLLTKLKEAATVDQRIEEGKVRIGKLLDREERLKKSNEDREAAEANAVDRSKEIIATAREEADTIVSNAEKRMNEANDAALEIRRRAEQQAREIVAEARKDAEGFVEKAQERLSQINGEIEGARVHLAQLTEETDTRQSVLDSLKKKLAQLAE